MRQSRPEPPPGRPRAPPRGGRTVPTGMGPPPGRRFRAPCPCTVPPLRTERMPRRRPRTGRTASAVSASPPPSARWELVARYLVGNRDDAPCAIVDEGFHRRRDLAIELPSSPLEAGDGDRGVGRGLRPHRRPRPRAPDDPRLRQHPAPRRARRPRPRRAARGERGGLAPREPLARTALRGGAASQGRHPHPPRRHRLAGARHRHRRRRPRMPARHDPQHRDLPAAGGALRARGGGDPEGAALPPEPGRPRGVRGPLRRGPARRARHPLPLRAAARRARAADRRRGGGKRVGRPGSCSPSRGAPGPTAPSTPERSRRWWTCSRAGSPRGGDVAAPSSTGTG